MTGKIQNAWKAIETEDYQKRGDDYPKSNIPAAITVHTPSRTADFLFKNTDEYTAEAFVKKFAAERKLRIINIVTYQVGDYEDDWVTVTVHF